MTPDFEFWDRRFGADTYVYGDRPNPFVTQWHTRFPDGGTVVDLGAGEGRHAVYLAACGYQVTAVDGSSVGLRKAEALARSRHVSIATVRSDVRTWRPEKKVDGLVTVFLHLPPGDRPGLYRRMKEAVRPGGTVLGLWYRPAQVVGNYTSGGPPEVPMLISVDELREHFPASGRVHLEAREVHLDEGPHHQGPAAVVELVWTRP